MKVVCATFIHPIDLPGKSMANHAIAVNPKQPGRGGFELSVVTLNGHDYLRVEVVWQAFVIHQVGAWYDQHDPERNVLHGLGRVCHIPLECCKKLEFEEDRTADMTRLLAEKAAPKKKTG